MDDNSTFIDIALYIGYFLVAVAALAAILMPLVKAAGDPKSLITIGGGLVGLVIIFFIAYALSDNEVLPSYSRFDITASGSQAIGGVIITMYLLLGLAVLSIAFTEISKLFR